MSKKILIISLAFILSIIILSSSSVLAYKNLCLTYGQSVPNDINPRYTCWHDLCQVCVTDLDNPTRLSHCYDIEGCEAFGEHEADFEAPELTFNSPEENEVYDSLVVLYDITSNEPATFSYSENGIDWTRIASNIESYRRELRAKEGLNEIIIKARDRNGNEVRINRKFYVDSKKPKIIRTYPQRGFIGSLFSVEYYESNVDEIKLYYGNEGDYEEAILENCDSGTREQCSIDVDLTNYDGQEIEYWFELKDIAGNIVESRKVSVLVDESGPVITELNYEKNNRLINFEIEIDEAFLDEVGYSYIDVRGNIKERRLCSRLTDNVCKGKASFGDGEYSVTIYARDKAGNSDEEIINLFIDSRKPKIKRTYPQKGFADGIFEVEFQEENPEQLILHYGNGEDILVELDIENDCSQTRRGYYCDTNVNLEGYDEVEYWFELIDKAENIDKSRVYSLDVDTVFPVLNNPESFWTQGTGRYSRYIYFDIEINEMNFDEVSYSYEDSRGRLRERRLCSRLRDGKCKKRVGFRRGHHVLDVQVVDNAGNAISEGIEFEVV